MPGNLGLLKEYSRRGEKFDPANEQHLKQLGYFIKNRKWQSGCPFYLEAPYLDIPAMCSAKYLEYMLT